MDPIILEPVVQVVTVLITTLIGVLGTYLTIQINKSEKLKQVSAATDELTRQAAIAVYELQQTVVEQLKANNGGKLRPEQITALGELLQQKVIKRMNKPLLDVLYAAGNDVTDMIKGAGEYWITELKKSQ